MQKEKNIFSVYKWTIMTKAISGHRSASQICYYIVPVLYLREDQELWHIFAKGYGPSRAREYFDHNPVLTAVSIGSWHV